MDKSISKIINIMESVSLPSDETGYVAPDNAEDSNTVDDSEHTFNPKEYVLAKQFVKQVGGQDRAKKLLDNLSEVTDILQMQNENDSKNINMIANDCDQY